MVTSWHEGEQGRRLVWIQCQEGAGNGQWVSNKRREKEEAGGVGEEGRVFEFSTGPLMDRGLVAGLERIKGHFLSICCVLYTMLTLVFESWEET